jgi:hypothetical protein
MFWEAGSLTMFVLVLFYSLTIFSWLVLHLGLDV